MPTLKKLSHFACTLPALLAFLTFAPAGHAEAATVPPASFADLVDRLQPAVVNISTTQTVTPQNDMPDMPDFQLPPGSPFEQFFHDFLDKQKGMGGARKHKMTALGSGFVIDPSGYIVTNNHVIDGADEITVTLQDDTSLTATLVGKDKKTDLALLKVDAKKPLPAVAWGDSDKSRVGDWVIAIGDPYGFGGTVTAGIISARARNINSGPYDDFLQTDAAINRGNSGGPMFNMNGEVVGVNTAIFSPSGSSIGIGFAIPATMAKNITDQLRDHGHIKRGWLGVRIQMVSQDIADSLGLGTARGALVAGTNADGPAAKAGVQPGDVIINFDGKDVTEMRRLPLMVAETEVGKSAALTVFRKGEEVKLTVKVGELQAKEEPEDAKDDDDTKGQKDTPSDKIEDLGINVSPLTNDLRQRYDLKKDQAGVVVVQVAPDGMGADHGLMVGDVISEAAQEEIKASKDLDQRIKQAKKESKPLLLLVSRHDDLRYVAISFAKKKK